MAATESSAGEHDARTRTPMRIELDETQAEALRVLLDQAVRDLSYEIADTDRPSFRRMLRERRATLTRILDMVGGPLSVTAWSVR